MNSYKHIFFDLDNTLWDFNTNSRIALQQLYSDYKLESLGVTSFDLFHQKYRERNEMMWEQYRMGIIDKVTLRDDRFSLTFWDLGLDAEICPKELSSEYLKVSPRLNNLFPHAHKVLDYLRKKYTLHIITNGFEEAQHIKLQSADLTRYFSEIIISEHTGYKKPDIKIFRFASEKCKAEESECVMIGDGLEADIKGAQQAGWDTVFFNPDGIEHTALPTFEIRSLDMLINLL